MILLQTAPTEGCMNSWWARRFAPKALAARLEVPEEHGAGLGVALKQPSK